MTLIASGLPLAVDPTPTPVSGYTGDPNLITPGVVGFIAIFVVAVATLLLIVDMTRRIRRVRYRAEVSEKLLAEEVDAALAGVGDDSPPGRPADEPDVAPEAPDNSRS